MPFADGQAVCALLGERLADEPFWSRRLAQAVATSEGRIHLAVFQQPFLNLLLERRKTVESRFSVNRIAPYEAIKRDDLILLKKSGGPVVGIALAGDPGFYALDAEAWTTIRARFSQAICAPDDGFWERKADAQFATLIPVRDVVEIAPLFVTKRDRRGWVVINGSTEQLALERVDEA